MTGNLKEKKRRKKKTRGRMRINNKNKTRKRKKKRQRREIQRGELLREGRNPLPITRKENQQPRLVVATNSLNLSLLVTPL